VNILLALSFFALGAISMGLFMVLMMAWHYARRPKPKRHLYSELKEGMQELERMREDDDRIRYQFMGITGHEE
jgi:hypothetical protein